MAIKEIVVPDIGGFSDVEVVEVLVAPGDTVAPEDSLITLETDKASMEIPAPEGGVVKELKVAVGDRIDEGGVILLLETEAAEAAADPEPAPDVQEAPAAPAPVAAEESAPAPPAAGGEVEVVVPDIGGFDAVEVIEVLVSEGDAVEAEDSLITLESDKASMEIPSPQAGVVKSIKMKVGDQVGEGSVILTLEPQGGAAAEPAAASAPTPAEPAHTPVEAVSEMKEVVVPDIGDFDEVEVIEVLVSPGDIINAEDSIITLESDKASMEIPSPYSGVVMDVDVAVGDKIAKGTPILHLQLGTEVAQPEPEPVVEAPKAEAPKPAPKQAPTANIDEVKFAKAYASPAVRRFARELGVDLGVVKGSGRKNRILKEDVQGFVKHVMETTASGTKIEDAGGSGIPSMPDVDFSRFGEIETQSLTKINRLTGKNLHRAWLNVPHVTQFDETDITDLEAFRKQLVAEYKDQGIKVTMLTFLVKAVAAGLKEFPRFNTSLDASGENLIQKKYINIGVAVDTPAGLVVPVIKDADKKSLLELAAEMMELGKKARDKKLKTTDMQGGCFTISSLGGLGGVQFTPIVNAPEVAILGVSRSAMKPVWNGTDFDARLILPLALSYDHRVIDGAAGVRFTSYLGRVLNDPRRLLL